MLHRKLRRVLEAEDLIEGSHDYKAAVALFDTFPKDELFAAPVDDLRRAVVALLALEGTDRVRLLGRRAPDGRSASFILALPRDRYEPALVERVRQLFKRALRGATTSRPSTCSDEGARVRVHFLVHRRDGLPERRPTRARARGRSQLARTWDDALRDALGRALRRRARRGCCGRSGAASARALQGLHGAGDRRRRTSRCSSSWPRTGRSWSRCSRCAAHARRALQARAEGRAGRRAADARGPRAARDRGDLDAAGRRRRDVGAGVPRARPGRRAARPRRAAATAWRRLLAAVHRGEAETDNLNRLVITAGLDRRQVAILRAYRKYRQRVGSRFTESYQNDVLVANSAITAKLVRYFELRFDPELETDEAAEAALRDEILADLDEVASLDHDRILRNQLTVIDATLRTNAYNAGPRRRWRSSCARADVPAMPQPAPFVEIYVYSPEVEGIHLRGGTIARGGLRWSDRQDYRTEVFGLMRAQLTKNAVIVPGGRQGRLLHQARRRARTRSSASTSPSSARCCRSPTTWSTARSCSPPRVRVRDERRHLPGRRRRQGHGDVLGHRQPRLAGVRLLARRRVRLRRLGGLRPQGARDHRARAPGSRSSATSRSSGSTPRPTSSPSSASATCRGDVFGNGMLLSRARSGSSPPTTTGTSSSTPTRTRRRASRSASGCSSSPARRWDDYDARADLRGRRRLPAHREVDPALAAGARGARASSDEALPPTEVIRAILRAPVDLLWNGGIGTVVKASTETDADAADRSSRRDPRRTRTSCARRSWGRAATSASRAARASSTRPAAGASTPTSSTTRPASTAPTTRST